MRFPKLMDLETLNAVSMERILLGLLVDVCRCLIWLWESLIEGLGHCILINMKYSSTELIISAAIIFSMSIINK